MESNTATPGRRDNTVENADQKSQRKRPVVVSFRTTEATAQRIEAAAADAGLSRGAWVRRLATKQARAAAFLGGSDD